MLLPPEICLFVFSVSITPGPNNVMIMTSGLNHGVKKSLPHLLGINLGFTLMLIIVGLGLGSLFEAVPGLHTMIKIIGASYLLYLAWIIGRTPTGPESGKTAKPITFYQAAIFQWVNPKAWVMITGAVATFTRQSESMHMQVLLIAATFLMLGPFCTATWLYSGVSLRRILRNPKYLRAFNISMAVLLVLSIRPVIVELLNS